MYISKKDLSDVVNVKKADGLFFNCSYDNRGIFVKDRVYLVAYEFYKTTANHNINLPLGSLRTNEEKFQKDKNFSAYFISHNDLKAITDVYDGNADVAYYIIAAQPDGTTINPYITYQIIIADKNLNPLEETPPGSGKFAPITANLQSQKAQKVVHTLDPCPPGTPGN